VEGGRLLVAVLESGGRRLHAVVVGHEGVEAVDHHFLRGHHHLADRRGDCRGGPESSPPRTVVAVASGVGRWGGRRSEEGGSERCVCSCQNEKSVPVRTRFFRLSSFSSSQWAVLALRVGDIYVLPFRNPNPILRPVEAVPVSLLPGVGTDRRRVDTGRSRRAGSWQFY
jgi:hypothetical protein